MALQSGLQFYSYGIVAQDKTDDSDTILVWPVETLPLAKGKLTDITNDYNVSGVDHKGVSGTYSLQGSVSVTAKWISFNTAPRQTAPNVSSGETVMLFQFGSVNDLFWMDYGREPGLRRLENIQYSLSNLSTKGDAYDNDSSYYVILSTRDKLIQLHTSDNDGEQAGFDITINTETGVLNITDTYSNSMNWDAPNSNLDLVMQNDITVTCRSLTITADDYIEMTATNDHITATSPTITIDGQTTTMNGSSSVDINGGPVTISGDSVTINPVTTVNAAVTVESTISSSGSISTAGDMTAGGKSYLSHTHLENGKGSETDPPT